ncbi:MAG: hypothetical protein R3E97_14440 [Candidatus Eisenbacteria bacterium]
MSEGGEFRGGPSCEPNPCDVGVCCLGEECRFVTEALCLDSDGEFLGDGDCDPDPCLTGACCVGTECTVRTEAACVGESGSSLRSLVEPTAWVSPVLEEKCTFLTELGCSSLAGTYLGRFRATESMPHRRAEDFDYVLGFRSLLL